MMNQKMLITSKIKDYQFEFIDEVLSEYDFVVDKIKYKFGNLFYFIDENVFKIYEGQILDFVSESKYLIVPALETNKDYLNLAGYYDWLIENKFTRKDVLVTIGGGILQDISGFIASTLYRGLKWVFIPTTLLSQADSCIGSKTSINFRGSKNLIGSFFPPDNIFIDIDFCKTLTPEYFNSGLGEIIKFHLLSDENGYKTLHNYLASDDLRKGSKFKNAVISTLKIKYSYFQGDEFDSGRRNLLNYGHCFGHALEAVTDFKVCHGEAVIVGMGFANLLALKRGIMNQDKYEEFENIFRKYYPKFDTLNLSVDKIIFHLKRDKKRVGRDLTMIVLKDIGNACKLGDVKEEEIKEVFKDFFFQYPN